MTSVRPPVVAGAFYPGHPRELAQTVQRELSAALLRLPPAAEGSPKAIIAPHAGYVYSGPIAASAYAQLMPVAGLIQRIVLIGPSHRVPFHGLAVPSCDAFETPLGRVPVDRAAIRELLTLPQVREWDEPHAHEHSLEVQLPFLQALLPAFSVVPLVVGDATAEQVAEVLERLWGGAETVIVVSSDLSHYLSDSAARQRDQNTCRAIEALDVAAIDFDDACGRLPIAGLLTLARRHALQACTLDLRNSSDTAGDRRRVVGYGAWMFTARSGATAATRGVAGGA